jgi:hypothetical protein
LNKWKKVFREIPEISFLLFDSLFFGEMVFSEKSFWAFKLPESMNQKNPIRILILI